MNDPVPGVCLRQPPQILIGRGSLAALPRAVEPHGAKVLVCTDRGLADTEQAQRIADSLRGAGMEVSVLTDARSELPLGSVEDAIEAAHDIDPEVVIGFGGGTCLDLAKLVSLGLSHDGPVSRYYGEQLIPGPCLPVVAIPTTSGTGSEVTPVAVLSDPDRQLKVGISSAELIPRVAICDPSTTVGAPKPVTAFSGIDALVHAIEARTADRRPRQWAEYDGEIFQGANSISDMYAERAIELISAGFERVLTSGADLEARSFMQEGALLAGLAFAQAGTAGAHALQYPIGSRTHTPHGLGVGLLAPYVLSYLRESAAESLAAVGRALGLRGEGAGLADRAISELRRLSIAADVPPSLRSIGIAREELPELARQGATVKRLLRNSPRKLEIDDLEEILNQAWRGEPTW